MCRHGTVARNGGPLEKAQALSLWTTILYNVSRTLVNLALQKPMLEPNYQEWHHPQTLFMISQNSFARGHRASYVPHQRDGPTKPFYDATRSSECIWLKNIRDKTAVAICPLQFACANEGHLLLDSCLIDNLKCDMANLIAQVLMWASGLRSSLYCLVTSGICLFHRLC